MNSNYRFACLQLLGLTFQVSMTEGQPIVVTKDVTERGDERPN
jgi:hypothetical protein